MVKPKYHVLICTSCRVNGTQKGFCHSKGSVNLVSALMEAIEEHDLSSDVMVSNTGCFGICDKGPVIVVYPEGVWYGNVREEDIERLVETHLENGKVLADLVI